MHSSGAKNRSTAQCWVCLSIRVHSHLGFIRRGLLRELFAKQWVVLY